MSDPVSGISGTRETHTGGTFSGGGGGAGERKRGKAEVQKDDFVEISKAARDHFPGKKRKSIFQYLRALLK